MINNQKQGIEGTRTRFSSLIKTDAFIVSFCVVLFSLGLFYLTFNFDRVPPILNRGIQPATFPKILLIIIIVLSCFDYFLSLKTPWKRQSILPKSFYHTLLIMIGFVIISKSIDFFLGLIFLSTMISFCWGERRLMLILLISVLFPLLVFLLFETMLNLRFPGGILTNLYYY